MFESPHEDRVRVRVRVCVCVCVCVSVRVTCDTACLRQSGWRSHVRTCCLGRGQLAARAVICGSGRAPVTHTAQSFRHSCPALAAVQVSLSRVRLMTGVRSAPYVQLAVQCGDDGGGSSGNSSSGRDSPAVYVMPPADFETPVRLYGGMLYYTLRRTTGLGVNMMPSVGDRDDVSAYGQSVSATANRETYEGHVRGPRGSELPGRGAYGLDWPG